ncbi:hypothetical protein GEMRC1_009267 [Eukaryota sp. GEM-RC1]
MKPNSLTPVFPWIAILNPSYSLYWVAKMQMGAPVSIRVLKWQQVLVNKFLLPNINPFSFSFLMGGDGCEHSRTRDLIEHQIAAFPETVIHTIGFGSGAQQSWLKEIAALGRGQYHKTTDTISLCDAFVGISVNPDRSAFV